MLKRSELEALKRRSQALKVRSFDVGEALRSLRDSMEGIPALAAAAAPSNGATRCSSPVPSGGDALGPSVRSCGLVPSGVAWGSPVPSGGGCERLVGGSSAVCASGGTRFDTPPRFPTHGGHREPIPGGAASGLGEVSPICKSKLAWMPFPAEDTAVVSSSTDGGIAEVRTEAWGASGSRSVPLARVCLHSGSKFGPGISTLSSQSPEMRQRDSEAAQLSQSAAAQVHKVRFDESVECAEQSQRGRCVSIRGLTRSSPPGVGTGGCESFSSRAVPSGYGARSVSPAAVASGASVEAHQPEGCRTPRTPVKSLETADRSGSPRFGIPRRVLNRHGMTPSPTREHPVPGTEAQPVTPRTPQQSTTGRVCSPSRKRVAAEGRRTLRNCIRHLLFDPVIDEQAMNNCLETLLFDSLPLDNVDNLRPMFLGDDASRRRFQDMLHQDGDTHLSRVRFAWHLAGSAAAAKAIETEGISCHEGHCACGRYGRGGYVATSAAKAHAYADSEGQGGERHIFLALILPEEDVLRGERGIRPARTAADLPSCPTEFCFVDQARIHCVFRVDYTWVPTGRRAKKTTVGGHVRAWRTTRVGVPVGPQSG